MRILFAMLVAGLWLGQMPATSAAQTHAAAATASGAAQPADVHAMLVKAYEGIRSNKLDYASGVLCSIIRSDPNNAAARRYLVYTLLAKGQPQDALAQLEPLGRLARRVAFDQCMQGTAYDMLADHEHAAQSYCAALEIDPTSTFYRERAVEQLYMLGNYDQGMALCMDGMKTTTEPKSKAYFRKKYNEMFANRDNIQKRIAHARAHANDAIPTATQGNNDTEQ